MGIGNIPNIVEIGIGGTIQFVALEIPFLGDWVNAGFLHPEGRRSIPHLSVSAPRSPNASARGLDPGGRCPYGGVAIAVQ